MPRILLSLAVLSALVLPTNGAAPPRRTDGLRAWAKKSQCRTAYGLYVGGKKAGYQIEEIKLGKYDGKEVLTVSTQEYFATLYDGEKSVKEETTTCHYELTGDGLLLFARRERKEDGKTLTTELTRHGKGMRVTTRQGKRKAEKRDVAMPNDTLALARALEFWLVQPRKAGDRFVKYSVAWDTDDVEHVDQKEIHVFKKKLTAKVLGEDREAFALDVVVEGGKLIAEMLPDARLINGKMGGLMTIRMEKEEAAKKMTGALPDLMDASCVVLDVDLGRSRQVDELKLELTNIGDFEVPASHRQAIKKGKDHVVLTLKRDFRLEKSTPLTKSDSKGFLRATPRLQSEHKAVVAQAKEIVGDEEDTLEKARLLARWVYKTLKKSYTANAERAIDVLDSKEGDCTEHSLLFVALARAAGVPAREVGGLAYVKQKDKPMMGWHAWAEVHDGHQWVSIDPTWDQVYVDGTHVKLSEGDKDQAWANIAGEVKIKVLDVKKRR